MNRKYFANMEVIGKLKKGNVLLIVSSICLLFLVIIFSSGLMKEAKYSSFDTYIAMSKLEEFAPVGWVLLIISFIIDIVCVVKNNEIAKRIQACFLEIKPEGISGFGYFDMKTQSTGILFNLRYEDIISVSPSVCTRGDYTNLNIFCNGRRYQLCIASSVSAASSINEAKKNAKIKSAQFCGPGNGGNTAVAIKGVSSNTRKSYISCKCGARLPIDSAFCNYCGDDVKALSNAETNLLSKEANSQKNKSSEQGETTDNGAVFCAKCGFRLAPDSAFCFNCGTEVRIISKVAPVGQRFNGVEWYCPTCDVINQNYVSTCVCGTVRPK